MRDLLSAVAAAALALALVLAALALAGHPPAEVVATGARGAVGSPNRIAATLEQATPLALCGLAAGVPFRAGVANVGGEGQYLIGAIGFAAAAAALPAGRAALVLALIAAALVGAAYALIALALERWRGVPLVLSTILLNLVAVHLLALAVDGPLRDRGTTAPQTAPLAEALRLPSLGGVHLGAWLALLAVVAAWVRQRFTAGGFAAGMIGLNPLAARLVGMPIDRVRAVATALGGALAGVAGGVQCAGVTHQLTVGTASFGYAGVAVALLGRLDPLGIAAAALFFAALDTGSSQVERVLAVPHDIGDVAKGLSVCAVLVGVALAGRAARRRLA